MPSAALRGLYLITPDEDCSERLLARVAAVLASRPALLQYRNKRADRERQAEQARALRSICASHGVPLIVNDDWRLALEIGAQGVHLGENDGSLAEIRARAPGLLLGASCYDDAGLARKAAAAGADYVAFGAFFPSTSKAAARRADPALLADTADLGLLRVAIGGLRPDNARPLVEAGVELLAVIAAVFESPDPLAAARSFQALFETHTPDRGPAGHDAPLSFRKPLSR